MHCTVALGRHAMFLVKPFVFLDRLYFGILGGRGLDHMGMGLGVQVVEQKFMGSVMVRFGDGTMRSRA